ncbi:MAG: NADH-quinone oxidoreductase subunit NuoG [Acidiferrobacterales bacterium]
MVTIEIDGKKIEAEEGSMLIQAADAAGIYIPRFCYHDKLSVAANCRMCLVEVEKAPKPLPACATPVAEGMKVMTRSEYARNAQKGTMEFLLINHPLDCPICDQGGECELQDLAVGYGKDASRYLEKKRIVKDKNIGPLIATEMTRCIHCTRCVRFGQEIAGIMELGATGRGEHTRIGTFMERSVDSELSGNVIDLCPVGALTSKPYRYQARPWELQDNESIAPHDSVGSNLNVQTRFGKVLRVIPRDNEEVNECWISDRDRFSYEALNGEDRLARPMIKRNGSWQEVEWQEALQFTADGLQKIINDHGVKEVGALASPTSTLEEFYLLQKLMRNLGSGNIDHRLRQLEFSDDELLPTLPWLGVSIEELENTEAVLLIGSNIRKEQPMLGHRLRKAAKKGAAVMTVNSVNYQFNYPLAEQISESPMNIPLVLAGIASHAAQKANKPVPPELQPWLNAGISGIAESRIVDQLIAAKRGNILLGNSAVSSTMLPVLRVLAQFIAECTDTHFGIIPEANSAGAWLAGAVPHRGVGGNQTLTKGRNVRSMLSKPLKAYITLGIEPELDCLDGSRARTAMHAADFVVMLTTFKPCRDGTESESYADVLLPITPFTETAGTFVNAEGRVQSFNGVATPHGEARPAWKVIRVLANLLGVDGFDQVTINDVRAELDFSEIDKSLALREWKIPEKTDGRAVEMIRLADVPMYAVDSIVRRATALQETHDNPPPAARLNQAEADRLGVFNGTPVTVRMVEGSAELPVVVDPRIPDGCVLVSSGYAETATLGAFGPATVVRSD